MFASTLRFELRYQLTRPITWFYVAVLIGQGVFFMTANAVVLTGGGVGQVARNAPWAIGGAMMLVTALDQVIVTGLVGAAILRDFQYRIHELVFTTPISKVAYLGGRFAAVFLVMAILHLAVPLGLMLGTVVPGVDPSHLQPFSVAPYLIQYVLLVLPTLFFTCALFFAVGAITRSSFAVYIQGMVLVVLWSLSRPLLGSVGNQRLAALADPFGVHALDVLTRYWTPAEKTARMVPLAGVMLENRLLWLGIGVLVLGVAYALFQFRSAPRLVSRTKVALLPGDSTAPAPLVDVPQRFDGYAWRRQVWSTALLSFRSVVGAIPFLAIVLVGIVTLIVSTLNPNSLYGEITWPTTYLVVESIEAGFLLFFVLLVTLYAGEAVWRERQLKLDQIADSVPASSSVPLVGNLCGMVLVEVVLLLLLMVAGILIQTAVGYTQYQPGLYLGYLFGITLPSWIQITVLAFMVHVVVNQKYAGHVVMIMLWVLRLQLAPLGIEHRLFGYAVTNVRYSDLNGYGPFLSPLALYAAYWSGVALLIAVFSYLLWVRGADTSWSRRLRVAGARWRGAVIPVGFAGLVVAVGAGAIVFYNTNVENRYLTGPARRAESAHYERTYRPLIDLALPRLVAEELRVDLEPERQAFTAQGTFTYVNKHSRPLDSVIVFLIRRDGLRIDTLAWDRPAVEVVRDTLAWTRIDRFRPPLAPGDTVRLRYRARFAARGFSNAGPVTDITANGTFLRRGWFPALGYQDAFELPDPEDRRKAGLPPAAGMRSLDDTAARANAFFLGRDADWIDFKATISTAPDQIALAPGDLVREYRENGRPVFEYASSRPIANDFAILSARYAVRRDRLNGIALEIYHHPGHDPNLDRMMAAMKAALSYYGASYSPYQFRSLRVAEFPRYGQFALGEPGLIPFSESLGFIFRPSTANDNIDLAFYVTAHEVAHQWWGHQVAGADVEGVRWISEGLANYSALLVMEKTYGQPGVRKFLAYELDRYLLGRSAEPTRERPLLTVENQPYIHYNKGSLALYAFRDLIGEAAMNRGLARFVAAYGLKGPPYPTSRDLVRYLAAETPDSVRYAIHDLFATVTLWDFRTVGAAAVKRPDGRYEVTVRAVARKYRSDGLGVEREIPIADLVDIGVFGEAGAGELGKPLYLAKAWIRSHDPVFTIVVDEEPGQVGIDPYGKLIDRDRKDNLAGVEAGRP